MKKIFALLLVLAMMLALASCGSKKADTVESDTTTVEEKSETVEVQASADENTVTEAN